MAENGGIHTCREQKIVYSLMSATTVLQKKDGWMYTTCVYSLLHCPKKWPNNLCMQVLTTFNSNLFFSKKYYSCEISRWQSYILETTSNNTLLHKCWLTTLSCQQAAPLGQTERRWLANRLLDSGCGRWDGSLVINQSEPIFGRTPASVARRQSHWLSPPNVIASLKWLVKQVKPNER